ncbi:MAG: SRPBCC domain-containing protein [Bacteroidota bacterium]
MSTPQAIPVTITIETTVNVPVAKAWAVMTEPSHIVKWNAASPDWHTPRAENDLRKGGRFSSRMEAKDGSFGFDFGGGYDQVTLHSSYAYTMDDGRTVVVMFLPQGESTKIIETFVAESQNPAELQRGGWQAILDNFKRYTESLK